MTESSRCAATDGDRSLEALWTAHLAVSRRMDELSDEFHRLATDVKNELRYFRTGKAAAPAAIPEGFSGRIADRGQRRPRGLGARSYSEVIETEEEDVQELSTDSAEEEELYRAPRRRQFHERNPEHEGPRFRPERDTSFNRVHGFRAKVDISIFDGHLHIEDYLEWEQAVISFFEYTKIRPEKQVTYVACKLKGGASAWWNQLTQSRNREGRRPVRTWARMKQLLRSHFLPTDFEQLLYLQY